MGGDNLTNSLYKEPANDEWEEEKSPDFMHEMYNKEHLEHAEEISV